MHNVNIERPLVSVNWLHENLDANNLLIFDASIPKVTDANSNTENRLQIPNSHFFDIVNTFSNVSAPFPNTIPSEGQFTSEARKLGVNNDTIIVVYDDKGIYSSARVWWLFKAFGLNTVAVLDGGLPEWIKSSFETEEKQIRKVEKGNFSAKFQPDFMRIFEEVVNASKNESSVIIDARSEDRFKGIVEEPRKGLRSGNIPNSLNLPFEKLFSNKLFKNEAELKALFSNFANKEDSIIFSCGSGITASILALGADLAGFKNIAVYDGSWTEYGSLTNALKTMDTPSNWTKKELVAYILLYVANSDLKETKKERDYMLSRVDKKTYIRVHQEFENDNDYQSINKIIEAVKTHDYYRNDYADLFADIKLMAFADGEMSQMEQVFYNQLKKILK